MDSALASSQPLPPRQRSEPSRGIAELVLEPDGFRARRGGRVIRLSALQMRLLTILAERPTHVFTAGELEQLLWNGRRVSPAALRATMKRLRSVLNGPGEAELIGNVRGAGYVLIPPPRHHA